MSFLWFFVCVCVRSLDFLIPAFLGWPQQDTLAQMDLQKIMACFTCVQQVPLECFRLGTTTPDLFQENQTRIKD